MNQYFLVSGKKCKTNSAKTILTTKRIKKKKVKNLKKRKIKCKSQIVKKVSRK